MKTLRINESLLYVPNDCTGIVSVCNNQYGTELACIVTGIFDNVYLQAGNFICIELIEEEKVIESSKKFVMPKFTNDTKDSINPNYGIEVCVGGNKIAVPFINGGAVTFVITINKEKVYVDVGSITEDKILLDYYHSKMIPGEKIYIAIKELDVISVPLRKRHFIGCKE